MEKKVNIEELEKQYLEAEKNFKKLHDQLATAKKEEEDRKQAELALIKETRTAEIELAINQLDELLDAWHKDYGSSYIPKARNMNSSVLPYLWHLFF